MADLIDRISGVSTVQTPVRPRISVHQFIALQRHYAIGLMTRAQIATELDLQGAEATQAGQIADQIDGQSNATNKITYVGRVEAVLIMVGSERSRYYRNGDGTINKALAYSNLQIAG